MIRALAVAVVLASIPAGLRWLRVAQREHYHAGSVGRFQWRWWRSSPVNNLVALVSVVGLVGSIFHVMWGFLVPLAQFGPIGLPVRGATSPLAWTPRLRRLAIVTAVVVIGAAAAGLALDVPVVVVVPLYLLPFVVDFSLWVLAPYEKWAGNRWVARAAARLKASGAEVVAITGSYGKTTTKNYVAHLLAGSKRVVASPASFNNRMGLARAINESLTPGTEIFVAEMGTYGPGEIAELCEWIPPTVAAVVAIGPVHLERFGAIETIVKAKEEIFDRAAVGVICVDDPLLAAMASRRRQIMPMVEVSAGNGIVVEGERIMDGPTGVFATNLAVALGICAALGVDLGAVLPRTADLPTAEHRQSQITAGGGFTIIDDTFNSNPAGARSALAALIEAGRGGKSAVVTPGMVELGHLQEEENRKFAEEAAAQADHLIVVGRTNRGALLHGSATGRASVTVVDSRDEAVEWVRANLGPGDAVLYENDLPDHYP
ncbi:MAG TPA: UDP-N-acetylmuramoyl-tripeptide--D-alanyl-D-alanine ligase [Acidimicrobiia bacterium]|nr:UDP-N-acetylmuramoyl-tripeptide--D-alanyl-D-alanine ligase [Acidimicrobiia bacterium]